MSEAMFDKNSWNRAMGPALRGIGYLSVGILIVYLIYVILSFLAGFAGLQGLIFSIFAILAPILAVFYLFLVIFKVLDEEMTGRS